MVLRFNVYMFWCIKSMVSPPMPSSGNATTIHTSAAVAPQPQSLNLPPPQSSSQPVQLPRCENSSLIKSLLANKVTAPPAGLPPLYSLEHKTATSTSITSHFHHGPSGLSSVSTPIKSHGSAGPRGPAGSLASPARMAGPVATGIKYGNEVLQQALMSPGPTQVKRGL